MKIPFPKYEAEVVEEIEAYLDMHYQTEIVQEGEDRLGLKYLLARGFRPAGDGRPGTRRMNNYARPMFDVISDGGGLSGAAQPVTPCQCYRFDQSWACSEHPEDRPDGWEARSSQPTAYDRLIETFGRELPRPSPGFTIRPADRREFDLSQYTWTPPPLDPNRNRPGYHYDFATDRWAPDGVVEGQPVSYRDIAAEERLTAEWERQNGVPLADAVRAMRENVSPFTPNLRRRLDALPDASLTLTLEITGDTTQASASTVRIEVERNGDTP